VPSDVALRIYDISRLRVNTNQSNVFRKWIQLTSQMEALETDCLLLLQVFEKSEVVESFNMEDLCPHLLVFGSRDMVFCVATSVRGGHPLTRG
jgi:hypothetical protein